MSVGIGVQRDGLRADPDAEVDLCAGWGDDLASADDPGAVRLRAGDVGRVRHGLSAASAGGISPAASRPASGRRRLFETYFASWFRDFGTCTVLESLGFSSASEASHRNRRDRSTSHSSQFIRLDDNHVNVITT